MKLLLSLNQMKKNLFLVLASCSVIFLQGCLEITENVAFNSDGSGQYSLSLTATGLAPALETMLGEDQLSESIWLQVLDSSIQAQVKKVRQTPGISDVSLDVENYSYTLAYHFDHVHALNQTLDTGAEGTDSVFSFTKGMVSRKGLPLPQPEDQESASFENEVSNLLIADGLFRAEYALPGKVIDQSNPDAYVREGKKTVVMQASLEDLIQGNATVETTIRFKKR